ncbi:MAG TPA: hypothetical protein VGI44_11345 [Acidimicrobiales bacterium]
MRSRPPSHRDDPVLIRTVSSSVLIGAASGLRSQLGLAAVVLRANNGGQPPFLRTATAGRTVAAAAFTELLVDKSPRAPDRLRPAGLVARLVLSGLASGLFAHSEARPVAPSAALASATALLAAKVGHDLRARAVRSVPDPVVAVAEDGLALYLAAAGTRPDPLR